MARLLVVDDEPEICEAFESILAQGGCTVRTCANGTQALDLFRKERTDVLFCDLKLPGLSGMAVLEAAKSIDPGATVIMVTAYSSVETVLHAMRLGAYDFLQKPFTLSQLQQVTHRALDHRRQLREIASLQGKPGIPGDIISRLIEKEQVKEGSLHSRRQFSPAGTARPRRGPPGRAGPRPAAATQKNGIAASARSLH